MKQTPGERRASVARLAEWVQEPKRFTLDGEPVDLGEFVRDNDFEPEQVNAVGRLEVGQEFWFGGGAAPLFVLRRVS